MIAPWIALGGVLVWGASMAGTYWWAYGQGRNAEVADHVEDEELLRHVAEAAQKGAADEIAKIKPKHTTIYNTAQREIQTHVVYRDCRHAPDVLRRVNEALTGKPDAAAARRVHADRAPGR